MIEAGIFDNDILVVDRAVKPRHNHVVVAIVDGDLTVKYLYQRGGRIKLKAANPTFPDILPKEGQTIEVWGVVTSTIKQFAIAVRGLCGPLTANDALLTSTASATHHTGMAAIRQ
jgi:DNA polymerase V